MGHDTGFRKAVSHSEFGCCLCEVLRLAFIAGGLALVENFKPVLLVPHSLAHRKDATLQDSNELIRIDVGAARYTFPVELDIAAVHSHLHGSELFSGVTLNIMAESQGIRCHSHLLELRLAHRG